MEEYHRHCDEVGFNADEAHNIVKECVDGVLGGEDYNQNNINQWTASIVEQSLTHLVKLGKAYKYIVTCAVVQKSAYGFHTARSCFWDTTSDGTLAISPSKQAQPAEVGSLWLRFARLSEHATALTLGSAWAVCYDLYRAYIYSVPPVEKALVKTDIQIALPSGYFGRVAPRSGLAAKHFIDVTDEDYRGNVGVVLFNFGKEKFEVKKGDQIA
ncbi:Deoxyuridine 5'-triphosphate nucleotidohydrolase, mitochondrial [Tupaia chinensis]|uniref:Deoxyuridine 5'-triphosphate nucleotidohydrolase n=1 Tax=Tupaia chinensis TaxID=246437 RepID=L9KSY3_TUPCH|nr:Deoxyuridine 5'-triphosphate nucleotidohydrolase, mitochondrial [Tupaia chinensis]